jgi:hypothetical protein
MLHLKSIGVYQKVERAKVFYMMGEWKGLYGLNDEFKFDLVLKDGDWAIRKLRKEERKDSPWFKSESLASELGKECLMRPGFGDLVERLLEEAGAPPEGAATNVQPGLDPRFEVIRDFIDEQAWKMGHTFVNSKVTMKTKDTVTFTVHLNPK